MKIKRSKDHWNALRLQANEIIRRLYEAGERDQIAILHVWTTRSLEELGAATPPAVPGDKFVIAAMVRWLENNQPDVFSRGIWDAINDAAMPTPQSPTDKEGGAL